ncbi:MAG: glycoside hydrolase family 47 protein [Ignavibacteria bacterium]|nr:glycoside hydrolase family 47 protein [Ignavibacteria bacterium]
MNSIRIPLLVIMLAFSATAPAQVPATPLDKQQLAEEVRNEFIRCWQAYKKYAWGHDGLRPLSKTHYDWYSEPFYLSAVDALDTMILMGLKAEADSTREFVVEHLSFDRDIEVKNFEFTIRLLGGLISGYQMTGDKRLLALAEDLADRLLPAFKSPTGMPYMFVNLKTGAVRGNISNPGEIGTLLVEFGALSMLTGKPVYYNTVKYALLQLFKTRSDIGLVGQKIDIETGEVTDTESHLTAGIDSYYEYLVKCWYLFDDQDCKLMWDSSITAVNRYLADSTETGLWYGHADMNTGKRTKTWFGALDAFFPAVLALSKDITRAEQLQASCLKMWNRHGIEPEMFDYSTMEVVSPRFFLNPEIIESAYYLYHFTGNEKYLEMGKTFLDSLKRYCRTDEAFAELKNVITKEKSDRMESYFLSETLKYLYLLFAAPGTLDFSNVIFNTEAHPIRRTW